MTPLAAYGEFFANMTPADLDRLDTVFIENARFVDPFNDAQGLGEIRAVFAHMFTQCAMARFEVLETVQDGSVGYIRWRFHFQLKRDKNPRHPIEGVSRVVMGQDGRVREHIDYWDAAGELYTQFPVLIGLMRWLKAKLSAV